MIHNISRRTDVHLNARFSVGSKRSAAIPRNGIVV